MESFDGIDANAALIWKAGACVVIHSDDPIITQRLNQEAAIAMTAGNKLGLGVTRAEAIKWITANSAKMIGIGDKTGSLEPGKAADIVVWSRDPFSVYAQAEKVYIDGALIYDRHDARFHVAAAGAAWPAHTHRRRLEHDPEKCVAVFRERPCSSKKLERDGGST